MCIRTLMRATDDRVYILSCQVCKVLIEIEVVTGKKCKAIALNFNNGGFGMFKRVVGDKLTVIYFAPGGVLFLVFTYNITLSVKGKGGVGYTLVGNITASDKKH